MWIFSKSKLIPLPSECKKIILLNALFQGGRLYVGAICVLYFLSFGMQMQDYAWIKTIQAVIFIGLDIPLGYFLSRVGEYRSILLSLVFGVIGALGYLLFTSFLGFLLAETFLALSLSIWPVALSSYSMKLLEDHKTEGIVEKFFHLGDAVSNLFVIFCGSLGGILYAFNKYIPYSCFLIFYLIAVMFTLFYLKDFGVIERKEKGKMNFLISNIKEILPILPIASILFLIQFFMQPIFHYWQPLFIEKFAINSRDMSILFMSYSFTMSTVSWCYSKVTYLPILRSNLFVVYTALIGCVVYGCIARFDSFSSSLIFFSLSFGVFNLLQIALGVMIQNKLKREDRMIITKYVSFYSRIGMIVSLGVLHLLFINGYGASDVYILYGELGIIAFCLYLGWIVIQKGGEKYVESKC